jgi:hypothetical protein
MPRLVDQHHRTAQEQRRSRLHRLRSVRRPVPLDRAGDVLHDREHHELQLTLRTRARVEDHQRTFERHRCRSVEQVGVGAIPAVLRQLIGEVPQRRRDLRRIGLARVLGLRAQLLAQQRLGRRAAEPGRLAVNSADAGSEHPQLLAVEAAHHHLMQRNQECDLLARHLRRLHDVPWIERVRRAFGADLDLLRAVYEPRQGLVVAGAVDHECPRPEREAAGHQHVGAHRLSTPAPAADEERVVRVLLVVEVQQLDRPPRVRERERDPRRRPALRPDQRQHVGGVHRRVLAHLREHVAAERERALPQLLLAEGAGVDLAVAGRLDLLGAEVDRL